MEETRKQPLQNDPPVSGRSLKKDLAVAAMAASLGISLGVPVSDVLAATESMSSPPTLVSRQDKHKAASAQTKLSTQSKLSTQVKQPQSSQIKLNTQLPQTTIVK